LKDKLIRLERILDATTEGWWEWNTETDQTLHGAGWFKMLGLGPIEGVVSNSLWKERIHPDDRVRAIENQQLFLKSDDPWEQEFRMLHQDGKYIWILSRGKVLYRSADGEALQVGGTKHKYYRSKKYTKA
jgi:two-component system sensor histidine kinase/response regulator